MPAAVGVKLPEPTGLLFPLTGIAAEVKTRLPAAQVLSFGPYSRNVMVPVGLAPLVRVAVSVTALPNPTFAEAWVAIVGVVLLTTTDSFASAQVPVASLLFASPR